jgi:hypothetical protein
MELLPFALLFAGLCSLNCLFIYAWEHDGILASRHSPHATTRLAMARLPALATGVAVAGAALAVTTAGQLKAIPGACALAALAMLLLDGHHDRFSRIHLRAAADLALLTPALLLPFLR